MLGPGVIEAVGQITWYLLLALGIRKCLSFATSKKKEAELQNLVKKKRYDVSQKTELLEARLLVDGQLLTRARQDILNLPILDLIAALQKKQYTALEVLQAYQAKALEVTKELNCITEFVVEADEWAKALDASGKIQGPLHGLPFSVKDISGLKGYDCTKGLAKFLFKPVEHDSAMVMALKSLGAVPFCRTNVPQSGISSGCSNTVWGETKNPVLKNRVPGGSSGGEVALIASGGSPFGIGSDIGGSLRAPAHFSGVAAMKCTANRLSVKNYKGAILGVTGITSVAGVMAKDVKTLTLINKLLLENAYMAKYDRNVTPLPWREEKFNIHHKLRIGYYDDDGYFPSTPGVRRAVLEAKNALEAQGHELVPFTIPFPSAKAMEGFLSILNADQCKQFLDVLKHEKLDPLLKSTVVGARFPHFLRPVGSALLTPFSKIIPSILESTGGARTKYSYQLWETLLERDMLLKKFIDYFETLNLDLCIGPAFASPAPLSPDIGQLFGAGSYSITYSYLNLPAGVLNVTHENDEDQEELAQYPRTDLAFKLVAKTTEGAQGAPLGVQVVGLPWEDELVLAGMNILEEALKKSV